MNISAQIVSAVIIPRALTVTGFPPASEFLAAVLYPVAAVCQAVMVCP
jgi:hypothetical protein